MITYDPIEDIVSELKTVWYEIKIRLWGDIPYDNKTKIIHSYFISHKSISKESLT